MPVNGSDDTPRSTLVARGLFWNTLYQVFQVFISFAAMLVLVRIIPVAEYGRAGVVLGWLTLLNTLNCGIFMAQALQEPSDVQPNWSLHWSAGFYLQTFLSLLCHSVAIACSFIPAYQLLAPLMHIAAVGLLLDWPSQLAMVMLQRDLNFRRLRIVLTCSMLLKLGTTISLGVAGYGAAAIIWGSHVTSALPPTIDLLVIRCWRPQPGWWRWPHWRAYRQAWQFGVLQVGAGSLYAMRRAVEATALPGLLGFTALGLFERAQALFSTTVGRVGGILIETVYPLLPRSAADEQQYRRQAMAFAQITLLVMIPGALFFGIEGPSLSRLLYGEKWHAADSLLWPGAICGLGTVMFSLSISVLEAASRLRTSLLLSIVSTSIGVPMLIAAWTTGDLVVYAWSIAFAQIMAGTIALVTASSFFVNGWPWIVVIPPLLSSLLAAGTTLALAPSSMGIPLPVRVLVTASIYLCVMLLGLRMAFPKALCAVVDRLPFNLQGKGWGRLLSASRGVS